MTDTDPPAGPTLERMRQLAAELNDIDDRIAKNELRITELKTRRMAILTTDLVELMDDADVPLLQVDGRQFKAVPYYKAAIPVEDQNHPGLAWLEANDAADLIKNQIVVEFARGSNEDAILAERLIKTRFQQAEVLRRRSVHHATLTKWLKELHESGEQLPPLDLIGGTVGRIVKITQVKE